ncbi:hypothetical protein ACWCV9_21320 [Streptomyces sp. NPDC001606]
MTDVSMSDLLASCAAADAISRAPEPPEGGTPPHPPADHGPADHDPADRDAA